jgi:putative hydrolase of the HAD superfamily
VRAVIFDLWDTLVVWPVAEAAHLRDRIAELVPVGDEEFGRRWHDVYRPSQTGPLAAAYRTLGLPVEHVDAHVQARHAFGRRVLRPRAGAVTALTELRRRQVKTAVITVCSEEVPAAWPASELAGLFDVETFSSVCGLMKPEPEIYLRTARALEVRPQDCLFVGDGANDELGGAARVGMTPVLFLPPGDVSPWPEVCGWAGQQVSSIEEVLELC